MIDHYESEHLTSNDLPLKQLLDIPADVARELLMRLTDQLWYSDAFLQSHPVQIPKDYPDFQRLIDYGIVSDEGVPHFRIHKIGSTVFVTDGVWERGQWSLFPFTDESQRILDYIADHNLTDGVTTVIDPACGCGHTPIALPDIDKRIGLDINRRAAFFTRINAHLNKVNFQFLENNILAGLPSALGNFNQEVLVVANMPFALAPYDGALSIAGDGGRLGTTYSVSLLKALIPYQGTRTRLVMLTYSLGTQSKTTWEIVQRAQEIFSASQIRWKLVGEKIWRTQLDLTEPNPMPLLEGLPKKVERQYQTQPQKYKPMYEGYQKLAQELIDEGWEVLGGGILDVTL